MRPIKRVLRRLRRLVLCPLRALAAKDAVAGRLTRSRLKRNRGKPDRKLEIGPGPARIRGFETLDIHGDIHVDYVADAAKRLPFPDETFSVIYASHVLEHLPWYQTEAVLREWVRILASGGVLEIWVPDALKICRALVGCEDRHLDSEVPDGWIRRNPDRDPCVWASGRLFYGDAGLGSWHRSLYTPRFLRKVMKNAGLQDVRDMDASEVRGVHHGWVNLGVSGAKP